MAWPELTCRKDASGAWCLDQSKIEADFDHIQFWGENKLEVLFPTITEIVMDVWPHKPTSNVSERAFSKAGALMQGSRSGLDTQLAEMMLFVSINRDFVPHFSEIPVLSSKEAKEERSRLKAKEGLGAEAASLRRINSATSFFAGVSVSQGLAAERVKKQKMEQ